jgi:RimJ/RimL family protein N-acetyltransferase
MIEGTKIRLREKRLADAPRDYVWKTDAELAYLDATSPLDIPFSRYLSSYAEELYYDNARRCCFAIETLDGKHIGNCMYYNVDEYGEEAELGILIGEREYWDKGYGTYAVTALITQIFKEINLKRVYLHTLDGNIRAQTCFQKCGFLPCGRVTRGGHNFIIMEIRKADWLVSAGERALQHSY